MSEHAGHRGGGRPPRRRFLRAGAGLGLGGGALLALDVPLAHAASVVGVRVWPARDYTRVTLELDEPLKFSHAIVSEPPRLLVDLEGIDVDVGLRDLVAKVQADDPYIRSVRVGQFKPRVMRLVFDLKAAVVPQLFTLPPIAQYRHRLVFDLYPSAPVDPLQTLLTEMRQREAGGSGATAGSGLSGPSGPNSSGSGSSASGPSASSPSASGATGSGAAGVTGPGAASTGTPAPGYRDPLADLIRERGGPADTAPAATREQTPRELARGKVDGPPTLAEGPASGTAAAEGSRSGRRPVVSRLVTVAIDPGHGGEDPGAIGARGTREKDVVLAVARELRERINVEPNMRAFLTRDGDYFVPLAVRVAKARRVGADLFISVHADAFVNPQARGASVFVLSERGASSTAARWLANKENRADQIGGVNIGHRNQEVAKMLLSLSTGAQIRDSSAFGRIVLAELGGLGSLHKSDIEQAGFAVLKAPDIPSILVETAFISNPQEEARLAHPGYQERLAEAIFRGVRRYFMRHPPAPRPMTT